MAAGDTYRERATELYAKAKQEADPQVQLALKTLALSYLRLSEQADRNALNDVTYETPSSQPTYETPSSQPNVQQQQQVQPEPPRKSEC